MTMVLKSEQISVPDGVTVRVKCKRVVVKGPRGELRRDFSGRNVEIIAVGSRVTINIWFGGRKDNACVGTLTSHIRNMIVGVTRGFRYKMKSAYAHFPINTNVMDNGTRLEIRNFLGEKLVRSIQMVGDAVVAATGVKDEIAISGNCIESVSQSAALIQQSTAAKNKDIRKFLDGIYVSERGHVAQEA